MTRFVNQIARDFTPLSIHSRITWRREITGDLRMQFSTCVTGVCRLHRRCSAAFCGQSGTSPALVYDMTRFVNQIARDFTPRLFTGNRCGTGRSPEICMQFVNCSLMTWHCTPRGTCNLPGAAPPIVFICPFLEQLAWLWWRSRGATSLGGKCTRPR